MAGITSTGLFSGIDANQIIDQLLQIEARPKFFAQQRMAQLQAQQAAFLDLNNRLGSLKSASSVFRTLKSFESKKAVSSDIDILTVSASTRAQAGSYKFVIDRLVSTQQVLTRGFSDRDTSAIGIDHLTIENIAARLDRETALADLNDGQGIDRGKVLINGIEIDLSRVATVNDVVDAINTADTLTGVSASISGGGLVITGVTSIANATGDLTADSLGLTTAGGGSLSGGTLTGATIYGLNGFTALSSLNDGRGVSINPIVANENTFDFKISVAGATTSADVRIGEIVQFGTDPADPTKTVLNTIAGAAANMSTVLERMNTALTTAGLTDVTVSLDTASGRIVITDALGRDVTVTSENSTTAEDLGIAGTHVGGTVTGQRVLAGINSTLISSLNGTSGMAGDGQIQFTTANASAFTIDVSSATTLNDLVSLINTDATNAGAITASLNATGNGLKITDNTTGANSLVIAGTTGADSATSLGIAGTHTGGVAKGTNLQLGWVSLATRLDTLDNGRGLGEGTFRITDSFGNTAKIVVDKNDRTLNDIVTAINNNSSLQIIARVNDNGDGLLIEEDTTNGTGTLEIAIEDLSGVVAARLNIEGVASGAGALNFLDGSYEQTITFDPSDTLDDIVNKVNTANTPTEATIINDGSGSAPFRLSFGAELSGSRGQFIIDSGSFDLDLNTLDKGKDALIFFGAQDPADGILLTSESNILDNVIQGVSIDITSTSTTAINVDITSTLDDVETQINGFIEAFNEVTGRISELSKFSESTGERGPLLGDGTAINLRNSLIRTFLGDNSGFSNTINQLADVGITLGQGGQIEYNSEKFRAAWERDPDAVQAVFTRRDIDPTSSDIDFGNGITARNPDARTQFTALGVIGQIEEFADKYITSIGGVLTERNNALNTQIRLQQRRIAEFDVRLESRRKVLSAKFLAMEQSIARFQSQGSTLSLLG